MSREEKNHIIQGSMPKDAIFENAVFYHVSQNNGWTTGIIEVPRGRAAQAEEACRHNCTLQRAFGAVRCSGINERSDRATIRIQFTNSSNTNKERRRTNALATYALCGVTYEGIKKS